MRKYEASILIKSPAEVVFDYFADMTHAADWMVEDFTSFTRDESSPIGLGSHFTFVTRGANATSVFTWDVFERPRELEFSGPRLRVGPGWVEGRGGYIFTVAPRGTQVSAWLQPKLGGLLALASPFARMRNLRLLPIQLARAKKLIEAR